MEAHVHRPTRLGDRQLLILRISISPISRAIAATCSVVQFANSFRKPIRLPVFFDPIGDCIENSAMFMALVDHEILDEFTAFPGNTRRASTPRTSALWIDEMKFLHAGQSSPQ